MKADRIVSRQEPRRSGGFRRTGRTALRRFLVLWLPPFLVSLGLRPRSARRRRLRPARSPAPAAPWRPRAAAAAGPGAGPVGQAAAPSRRSSSRGTKALAEETLLYYLGIQIGKPLDEEQLNRKIKELWDRCAGGRHPGRRRAGGERRRQAGHHGQGAAGPALDRLPGPEADLEDRPPGQDGHPAHPRPRGRADEPRRAAAGQGADRAALRREGLPLRPAPHYTVEDVGDQREEGQSSRSTRGTGSASRTSTSRATRSTTTSTCAA